MVVSSTQSAKKMRLAQKRKKKQRIKLLIVCISLVLLWASFMYVSAQEWAGIKVIRISGNTTVPGRELEASIFFEMSKVRFYTLYAGTIFTYDKRGISEALQYKYPQFSSVKMYSTSINSIDVKVTERDPVAIWCDGDMTCYYVDGTGYIYMPNTNGEESNLVTYYGGVSGLILRGFVLPGFFENVQRIISELNNKELVVSKVEVSNNNNELKIHLRNDNVLLRVKVGDDPMRIADYVSIVFESEDYKEYLDSGARPEYIDLRFGNRVYYK